MKKSFLALILPLLFLTACTKTTPTTTSDTPNTNTQTSASEDSVTKTLKDLLALGKAQKCTYTVDNEGAKVVGEVIMNNGKFKQTTNLTTEQGDMKVYAISDGEWMYSWNDQFKQNGIKMKLSDIESGAQQTGDKPTSDVDFNKQMNYNCSTASVSDADLTIPSDVEFVDFSKGFDDIQKMMEGFNPDKLKDLAPPQE